MLYNGVFGCHGNTCYVIFIDAITSGSKVMAQIVVFVFSVTLTFTHTHTEGHSNSLSARLIINVPHHVSYRSHYRIYAYMSRPHV